MVASLASTDQSSPSLDNLIDELYGTSAQESAREEWAAAVHAVAAKASDALPESHTRINKAVKIVLSDGVELLDGNKAKITSQSKDGTVYHIANGECDCEDFEYRAPAGWCKHRLSRAIYLRAARMIEETAAREVTPAEPAAPTQADITAQFIVELHGKQFVTYAGLLALAHQRGLLSLTAKFNSVSSELALAEATATFADGRTFSEAADATPTNVGRTIAPHFARMALTRAKARCLRDALNIAMCSREELAD